MGEQSSKHGPVQDEQLAHELRGEMQAGRGSSAEEWREDQVWLDATDASIAGADDGLLADAVVFGATPRAVDRVAVAGKVIVEGGRHVAYDEALAGFLRALKVLSSGALWAF